MEEKKNHGGNMSIDIKTKEELLEALHKEAGKPIDELDADEIDRLVGLLEQYDEDKHTDTSDYEEFLQRFNAKNNTNLTSSTGKKKHDRVIQKLHITKKRKSNFVAAAAVLIVVVVSSQALVTASTDKAGSNWVTMKDGWVRFYIENSKYESWVEKETNEEETKEYVQGNPNVIKMKSEQYDTTDINEVKKFNIMIPSQLPEGYDIYNINIIDLDQYMGTINISYKMNKDNWISYTAELKNSENAYEWALKPEDGCVYVDSVEFRNFTAYVFQKERRIEAYFCYDGVIYRAIGETSLEEMYDILESVAYPE